MGHRWAIADIHGCMTPFRTLVEEKIILTIKDTLYLLGDYIDRGPNSKAVVDYILKLQAEGFTVVPLMGNHEYMLLMGLMTTQDWELWMKNQGMTTLRDFGIDPINFPGPKSVYQIPFRYLEFFQHLPFYIQTEDFFLVHAGLNAQEEHPLEDLTSMIWIREEGYPSAFLRGRRLIHGHTPIPLQEIRRRIDDPSCLILNIDGGCVFNYQQGLGNLVAFNLDTGQCLNVANHE